MRKRGITDFDLCMVDPWSAGNFGVQAEHGRRLSRALTWVRSQPERQRVRAACRERGCGCGSAGDAGHGHRRLWGRPTSPEHANYSAEAAGARTDLKPIEINLPEGASFEVDGHDVRWQKWHFRIGFTPREGLVLHTVTYEDQGESGRSSTARP